MLLRKLNFVFTYHLNLKRQAVLKYVSKKFNRKFSQFIWRVGRAYLIYFEEYLV